MPRTLFSKIFLWSAIAQVVTLGSILALVIFYLPDSEDAVSNAWSLYAHTAVTLYEKFGPAALNDFLSKTGEDTLLQLQLALARPETRCAPQPATGAAAAAADSDETTTIAAKGLEGDYCLTVHAKAGGLPDSPESRRSRLEIAILFELVSCAVLSYFIARYLSRPISELRTAAARLAEGDLTARVGSKFASREDEAADLVREFDQMAERISDLVEAQRRLVGDISHEIKSPLGRLSVALGLARRSADKYAFKQFDRMQQEIENVSLLAGELLTLASLDRVARGSASAPVDLAALVEEIVADAVYESGSRARDVAFHKPMVPFLVRGDKELLRRAVENVIRNAIFYTAEGIEVAITLAEKPPASAQLTIRDYGPGVPEQALAHLFEPFYRVDEARARKTGGTGIGLAICQRAVQLHGGIVRAQNGRPHGLVIEIELPVEPAVAERTPEVLQSLPRGLLL